MRKFYIIRNFERGRTYYFYYDYYDSKEEFSENIHFATLYDSEEHATRELFNLKTEGFFDVVAVYRNE